MVRKKCVADKKESTLRLIEEKEKRRRRKRSGENHEHKKNKINRI